MSNYKLEVENTEKLKNDINSAFTEINNELEKDDSLVANDLFDVDKKIEELKKSRKKWASGDIVDMEDSENLRINIHSLNINFNPTIFVYSYVATGFASRVADYRGLAIIYNDLENGFHTRKKSGYNIEMQDNVNEQLSGNISDEYIPNGYGGIRKIKNLKWLAFE